MSARARIAIGCACMVIWFYLVISGKAPVDPFVEVLKATILSVGVYHATLRDPKV